MHSVLAFTKTCIHLERRIGDLYRRFAGRLGLRTRPAQVLSSMAAEEEDHARSLELVSRLLGRADENVFLAKDADRRAADLGADLDKAHELLDRGRPVETRQALELAARIEATVIETHKMCLVKCRDENLCRTLEQLVTETAEHRERVTRLLREMED